MEVIINDNKLVIITEPKTIHFDLPKDVGNNLKHKIYFIIKCNAFLAEHTIKNETGQLLSKYKHGNDIHEQQKPMKQIGHLKFVLSLLQILYFRDTNKHVEYKTTIQK